jgi:NADPH:quinone reductase-like Zn-dependent oxidoreductase
VFHNPFLATMNALRAHARGGPEQLVYEQAPRPEPGKGEALVRVRAAAITPTELTWDTTWSDADGRSRVPVIPSHEVSGVVADLGPGVTDFRVGEAVFGLVDFHRDGAAAEYVAVPAGDLAPSPASADHVQRAALSLSALTAWQGLFDHGGLAGGQRVLIHGGAGGVGSFAVQLAHWVGAEVIATASASDAGFVRDLGANTVLDYGAERYEDATGPIDVVLDTVGAEVLERSWSVLGPGGTLVSIVERPSTERADERTASGTFFIVEPNREQLKYLARLADDGKIHPVVSAVFPLSRGREAFEFGLTQHARGKIVLTIEAEH